MKKHIVKIILVLCGTLLLSSCLKNDPEHNATIYYAYQQIPNINEYMPHDLLLAMGQNHLFYDDEPPKLQNVYIADSIVVIDTVLTPGSHWQRTLDWIAGYRHLDIHDQHMGIAKLEYVYRNFNFPAPVERSSTDTTTRLLKQYIDDFLNDSIAPVYFDKEQYKFDVFENIYVIGHDPYFTIFFYDIKLPSPYMQFCANIISGKLDKEIVVTTDTITQTTDTVVRPVIKDFRWGIETMKYFKHIGQLDQILHSEGYQTLPREGDIVILKNARDVRTSESEE